MQKFLSKYGLAAHLSLLAVSPLFLFPFYGHDTIAPTLLWLSLVAFVWTLVSPSQIHGEMLHESRARVLRAILLDPLTWVSLVLVVFAAVRWLNCGARMVYDAESLKWSVGGVSFPLLPSGAEGSGQMEFSTVVAVSVVLMSTRHALGKAARAAFLYGSSVLAGLAGIVACLLVQFGQDACTAAAACSAYDPQYVGVTFSVFMLGGVVGYALAIERKSWALVRPLSIVAFGGGLSAVAYFAPPIDIAAFTLGLLVLAILSSAYCIRYSGAASTFRGAALLAAAVIVCVLFIGVFVPDCLSDGRLLFFRGRPLVPEGFLSVREVMVQLAQKAWKAHLWLGTGIDTARLQMGYLATDSDWMRLSPIQVQMTHGWWQLLSERGIVGAICLALPCVFMAWTYFRRLIASFGRHVYQPACWLAPVLVCVLVGSAFFGVSFLRPDCLLASAALISVSTVSFPPPPVKEEAKEDETLTGDMPFAGGMAKG